MQCIRVAGLLPCAHCGGKPFVYRYPYHETPRGCGELHEIECAECGIRTGKRHSLTAAVIVWNRRGRKLRGGHRSPAEPRRAPETPAGGQE